MFYEERCIDGRWEHRTTPAGEWRPGRWQEPMTAPDTRDSVELLPCPFCGCAADWCPGSDNENWAGVTCKACGVTLDDQGAHCADHAREAWNRRALPQQAGGEDVERLARWLDAKYSRHREEEDAEAATVLRALQAEVARLARESDGYRKSRNAYEEDVVRLQAALREAQALRSRWQPIDTAPQDTPGIVVEARMTCCGAPPEGRVVMVAGRQDGTWVYPGDHCFAFLRWSPLPPLFEEVH